MLYFTFLIMERFQLKHSNNAIYFTGGIALFLLFLYNGLYFMLPLNEVNPFEYFFGLDLQVFNLINILTDGTVLPLLAIISGYLLNMHQDVQKRILSKNIVILSLVLLFSSILLFPFDHIILLSLMLFVGLIFIGKHWIFTLAAGLILFIIHLLINVVLEIIQGLNSNIQHMYSGIQTVNEYLSIYRSSDYLAMVNNNLDVLLDQPINSIILAVFTILPWILIGIALNQVKLETFFKDSPYLGIAFIMVLILGGLSVKLIQVLTLGNIVGESLGEGFGGPVLAVGYFMFLMYMANLIPEFLKRYFVSMGKYGISLYLIFNIIMMFIFYGIGFTLYGEITVQIMILLVTGIYCFFILLCQLLKKKNTPLIESIFR